MIKHPVIFKDGLIYSPEGAKSNTPFEPFVIVFDKKTRNVLRIADLIQGSKLFKDAINADVEVGSYVSDTMATRDFMHIIATHKIPKELTILSFK